MTDHVMRLVVRCADMIGDPTPGAVTRNCHRCGHQVYMDATQPIPLAYQAAVIELICVECALADPGLRPDVLAMHKAVRGFTAVQRQAEAERQQQRPARSRN